MDILDIDANRNSIYLFASYPYLYFIVDGVIQSAKANRGHRPSTNVPCLRELAEQVGCSMDNITLLKGTIKKSAGDSIETLKEKFQDKLVKAERIRQNRSEQDREWDQRKLDGLSFVIAMDFLDIYQDGFSVSLLFNSSYTAKEQLELAKDNKQAIMDLILRNIQKAPKGIAPEDCEKAKQMITLVRLDTITAYKNNLVTFRFLEKVPGSIVKTLGSAALEAQNLD